MVELAYVEASTRVISEIEEKYDLSRVYLERWASPLRSHYIIANCSIWLYLINIFIYGNKVIYGKKEYLIYSSVSHSKVEKMFFPAFYDFMHLGPTRRLLEGTFWW